MENHQMGRDHPPSDIETCTTSLASFRNGTAGSSAFGDSWCDTTSDVGRLEERAGLTFRAR
jgi:hypothetical protein